MVEMTEIVMPSDTNHLGTCFGGTIMGWIDKAAAIAAQRLVDMVVTASVDTIEFKKPIKLSDVVTLKASVNRLWKTSMEIGVKVLVQPPKKVLDGISSYNKLDTFIHAYLTFISVNELGKGVSRTIRVLFCWLLELAVILNGHAVMMMLKSVGNNV
jgi:acyl-CoA hydrolase